MSNSPTSPMDSTSSLDAVLDALEKSTQGAAPSAPSVTPQAPTISPMTPNPMISSTTAMPSMPVVTPSTSTPVEPPPMIVPEVYPMTEAPTPAPTAIEPMPSTPTPIAEPQVMPPMAPIASATLEQPMTPPPVSEMPKVESVSMDVKEEASFNPTTETPKGEAVTKLPKMEETPAPNPVSEMPTMETPSQPAPVAEMPKVESMPTPTESTPSATTPPATSGGSGKIIAAAIGAIILVVGITAGVFAVKQNQDNQSRAALDQSTMQQAKQQVAVTTLGTSEAETVPVVTASDLQDQTGLVKGSVCTTLATQTPGLVVAYNLDKKEFSFTPVSAGEKTYTHTQKQGKFVIYYQPKDSQEKIGYTGCSTNATESCTAHDLKTVTLTPDGVVDGIDLCDAKAITTIVP
jgi:hypothetical protein